LHEVFDCEHADIAAVLGTKAATARQHLARARRRLRSQQGETPPDEKLCRELIRRFQAALDGIDVPAMVSLLGDQQPVFVREAPQCANDASYDISLAA
jgi:RNA polymerase sigma-70 factor (ECF subfamily)